jgi:hypothetical protein
MENQEQEKPIRYLLYDGRAQTLFELSEYFAASNPNMTVEEMFKQNIPSKYSNHIKWQFDGGSVRAIKEIYKNI